MIDGATSNVALAAGKRIAIVGAGAVGSYTGGRMALTGADVTLIDPWPAHIEAIRAQGLQLSGMTPEESHTVKIKAMHVGDVQQIARQQPIDIAFICTISYDTEWATQLIRQYLAPDGVIVSLQNGINEDAIAAHIGADRVLGCIASLIAVELHAPGCVKRLVPAGGAHHTVFHVGELDGRMSPRAEAIAALLRAVDSATVTANLRGERWSKLVVNSMRNGLSAVTGMTGNQRDLDATARWLGIRLGSQAVRVGQALRLNLFAEQNMQPETLARAGEGDMAARDEIEQLLIAFAHKRSDDQRPSTAHDILRGRRTEIDYINGYVAKKGRETGVDASLHVAITELVKIIERGELKPGPGLVAGL